MIYNILKMSLSKSRLDISSLSATRKKPGTKYPAFLFSDSSRACSCKRIKTKKPKLCTAQRGFFLVKHPPEDHERSPPMLKASVGEASNPQGIVLDDGNQLSPH